MNEDSIVMNSEEDPCHDTGRVYACPASANEGSPQHCRHKGNRLNRESDVYWCYFSERESSGNGRKRIYMYPTADVENCRNDTSLTHHGAF